MNSRSQPRTSLAADAAVVRKQGDSLEVLMIRRAGRTFQGYLAFPGGFVEYNEAPEVACVRELQEETSLIGKNPQLIGVYGEPGRDPRSHVVSIFYYVEVSDYSVLNAADDASHAAFYSVDELLKKTNELAFDHAKLLADLLKFIKDKGLPNKL